MTGTAAGDRPPAVERAGAPTGAGESPAAGVPPVAGAEAKLTSPAAGLVIRAAAWVAEEGSFGWAA